ncbi:FadR/GntR family transcriptional regulator [Actinoplanes sp. CA-051413]|uniref:FadR/GntR family transcriptional regulator n=1 Tax=Actinoplanes sp. CA-051413 TaxID=3239899 RepID=UPI003D96E14A
MAETDVDAEEKTRGSGRAAVRILGDLIAAGDQLRPGDVVSLDYVMEQSGGSRALAREVLQVLQIKGLVTLQPRVGAKVQPVEQWNPFDPDVIEWRHQVAPRVQMDLLTQLREAVEPQAARLAAQHPSADVCRDLISLSRRLKRLGLARDEFRDQGEAGGRHRERYRATDEDFHVVLLKGSGNDMFVALSAPVTKALNYRIERAASGPAGKVRPAGPVSNFPEVPEEESLWLHLGLAHCVAQGLPEAAETFSRAILEEVRGGARSRVRRYAIREALDEMDLDMLHEEDRDDFAAVISAIAGEI